MNHLKPVPCAEQGLVPTRTRNDRSIALHCYTVALQPEFRNKLVKARRLRKRGKAARLAVQNYRERHDASSLAGDAPASHQASSDYRCVLSTGAVQSHRTAEWRDPRISLSLLRFSSTHHKPHVILTEGGAFAAPWRDPRISHSSLPDLLNPPQTPRHLDRRRRFCRRSGETPVFRRCLLYAVLQGPEIPRPEARRTTIAYPFVFFFLQFAQQKRMSSPQTA